MLTEQQVTYFKTFGFLVMRQVFTPQELDTIDAEFKHSLDSLYRHKPFDGSSRQWAMMLGPDTPFFASLLDDPRFYETAEQLYGEDVFAVNCDALRYVGNTNWHRDTQSLHQYGVKIGFYLEPLRADSGALRIVPGSFKNEDINNDEIKRIVSQAGLDIPDVPAYVCESEPGDAIAFDLRSWHASWGGSQGRRMCTLVYYNNPKTSEEEEATRRQATEMGRDTAAKFGLPDDYVGHHPEWLANREGSARRRRWIDRMRELGFLDS